MSRESYRRLRKFGPGPALRIVLSGLGLVAIPLIAWLHALSGLTTGFAVFYLPAIALAARYGGTIVAFVAAAMAAVASGVAQRLTDLEGQETSISLWVGAAELIVFAAMGYLIASLGRARRQIHDMARLDPLTGAASVDGFHDAAWREVLRAQRYGRPITVAYLDIDGFEKVNKKRGRAFGDELLKSIATVLKGGLRTSDTLERMRASIRDRAGDAGPLTVGIGAATFMVPPEDLDDMLDKANRLLKKAKETGPDATEHTTFQGTTISKTSEIALPERRTATSQERIEAAKSELRRMLEDGKQGGGDKPGSKTDAKP